MEHPVFVQRARARDSASPRQRSASSRLQTGISLVSQAHARGVPLQHHGPGPVATAGRLTSESVPASPQAREPKRTTRLGSNGKDKDHAGEGRDCKGDPRGAG